MSQKSFENYFENLEKPVTTGVLRFFLFSELFSAPRPVTLAELQKKVETAGFCISRMTLHRCVTEMIQANAFSHFKLQSVIVRSGSCSKARAFYISPLPKSRKK